MRGAAKVLVAISLVAGVVATTAAPAVAAPTTWSIRPSTSPPGPPSGILSSIACPTATKCFAVGAFVLQQWNGTAWSLVKNVIVPGENLNGIACPDATTCIAVGATKTNGVYSPLAKRWNGTAWSTIANPVGVTRPDRIACTSTTHCFALESFSTGLSEWNGTSWSGVTTPVLPDGSAFMNLTCASATRCFIAGAQYVSFNNKTLIEQWNGSAWSLATTPTPNNTSTTFNDVSCASATMCVAVGEADPLTSGGPRTFAAHWNGTTWTGVSTPSPAASSTSKYLLGVSCASTTDCFAISAVNLILHWNGTSWATVASPADGVLLDELFDIVCLSPTSCLSVGLATQNDNAPTLPARAAAQRWNGTKWAVQSLPQLTPSNSSLAAVSCRGSVCFGVGQETAGGGKTQPLIERASASGWNKVTAPHPSNAGSSLAGVSCPSTAMCVAVGRTLASKTLALIWRGKGWSLLKTPNKGEWPSALNAVSCVNATNCWAVGNYNGYLIGTLIEHWNGKTWTIVPSPSRKPSPNYSTPGINNLAGISCVSATFCMAVGWDSGYPHTSQETLVERWNGTKWSLVKSVNAAGGLYNSLASVACTSTKSCWAVGDYFSDSGSPRHPLIEHWNGTAWKRFASPDPVGTQINRLLGVACPTATQCVAVGVGYNGAGIAQAAFAQALAGSTWHLVSTPSPAGAESTALNGVACPSAAQCNAVGGFSRPPAAGTLVERFS